jgi:hypothetical protein
MSATEYHEAGHAVVGILRGIPIKRVTIEPTRNTRGHCRTAVPVQDLDTSDFLVYVCAGAAAEQRYTGRPAAIEGPDLDQALVVASFHTGAALNSQATVDCIERHRVLADAAVTLNWGWVGNVARALLRKRTLTGANVADLMG